MDASKFKLKHVNTHSHISAAPRKFKPATAASRIQAETHKHTHTHVPAAPRKFKPAMAASKFKLKRVNTHTHVNAAPRKL